MKSIVCRRVGNYTSKQFGTAAPVDEKQNANLQYWIQENFRQFLVRIRQIYLILIHILLNADDIHTDVSG